MNFRRILTVSLILGAMLSGSALGQPPIDCNGTNCTVAGAITDNVTFEAGNTYLLHGQVVVEEPAVLTIEAGTLIHGASDPVGALIISQGAQIRANGTADEPIVMTSSKPVDERAPADWGGLVINGRAPINNPGGTSQQGNSPNAGAATFGAHIHNPGGTSNTGVYGGDRPMDDSGHLHYVRIEYAGDYAAFSFQGVGSRTEVDHVMAYRPFGDCLEFYGGTVSVKRVLCIGGEDDSFDWKDGWQGKAQFIIIMQDGENPSQGVEGGNNADGHDLEPRAQPQIYNLTVIGNYGVRGVLPETDGPPRNNGILLRRGTGAIIRNFIVTGFARSAVEIDNAATFALAADERLSFASGIVDHNCAIAACSGQFIIDEDDMAAPRPPSSIVMGAPYVTAVNPMLFHPYDEESPDFTPRPLSPAVTGRVRPDIPPYDGFFEMAAYIGAVGGPDDLWWQGWTGLARR